MTIGLTNPSTTPTSELQDAYQDLQKFLKLRSNEQIILQSDKGLTPAAQIDDGQVNTSMAISTLLSPDGAFMTKDMPDILDQLKLNALNDATGEGQISINGATDTKFGRNLFYALGINEAQFAVTNATSAQQSFEKNKKLLGEERDLRSRISSLQGERIDLKAKAPPQTVADATRIDEIDKIIAELTKQAHTTRESANAAYDDAIRFKSTSRSTSVLRTDTKDIVALYRHAGRYLDPASAASDYCNVFFNAIDSINMSMCVPFFRMNIIDRFAKKKGRHSKLSLAAFLNQSPDASGDKIFYNAEPFSYTSKVQKQKIQSGKVVGMETFFAPQTLLPDPTEVLSNPRRLDTSVPLLSLNSFSIGVESIGIALLSKKTADLSITLHDRSRLTDISPLVSVGNFSSLYFEIEWGWSHPHGAAKFDNPVARYLNALRFREVFTPVSYNMTMGENGSMNIAIRLIGGASLDAVNGSVLNGGFITRGYATQILDKLIKSEISGVEGELDTPEEIRAVSQIIIDKSRTGQMIDGNFVKTIWEYCKNPDRSDGDLKILIEQLSEILKQADYYRNDDILSIIKQNMPNVESGPGADLFKDMKSRYVDAISAKEFTSVGGYLALLVGLPLAATGLYSEIQLHTFKFNDAAGKVAGKQISDAPIRIADVLRNPDQPGSLSQNTSVSNALTLLTNYLGNPKQPLYGISSFTEYSSIKVDDTQQTSGEPAKSADTKSNEQADTFKKPPNFVTPNIRCFMRSMPAKEYIDDSKKTIADYDINPEKLVAQIIVYDANSSPSFEKIIGAYGYTNLKGLVDDKALSISGGSDFLSRITNSLTRPATKGRITPDIAKDVFKQAFPSIIYGATNSVLKSVSVSTDINNAIAQQNILDVSKDIILGRSKSDASTDVGEISLFPGAITISMIGLPIIERGQEIYLDLGTGTTLDALYYVTAVKHDFRPGDYTTNLTLTYKGQGSVMSLTTMLESFNDTLSSDKKANKPEAAKESAPTTPPPPAPPATTTLTEEFTPLQEGLREDQKEREKKAREQEKREIEQLAKRAAAASKRKK